MGNVEGCQNLQSPTHACDLAMEGRSGGDPSSNKRVRTHIMTRSPTVLVFLRVLGVDSILLAHPGKIITLCFLPRFP